MMGRNIDPKGVSSSAPEDHGDPVQEGRPAQMANGSFARRNVYDCLCPPPAQPGPWDHQEQHREV